METLTAQNTDIELINAIYKKQVQKKKAVSLSTYKERIAKLKLLKNWITSNEQLIKDALYADFKKPESEAILGEIYGVMGELNHTIKHLDDWMSPQKVSVPITLLGTFPKIIYEAKGNCLIIAPWNYPFNLALKPVVQAIGAGNTVILKPSEMTPNTSMLIKTMINELYDENEIAVVEGEATVAQHLLSLKFDNIFFTGSPNVGKIVMTAAAKNLTSVTLELGGKSPCIIDDTADIKTTAERVAWGKVMNNGQTCIAPDYVLVHHSKAEEFKNGFKNAINNMYGTTGADISKTNDYCRIVNARHFNRIKSLVEDAVQKGANVEFGGQMIESENFIAPTLLVDVKDDMKIMQEEIFGPVLPIIEYNDINDVVQYINEREKPLALYIFSSDRNKKDFLLKNTTAGGTIVNDTLIHYGYPGLPFGGVNNSGIGKSGGHFGFIEFSNQRALIEQKMGMLKMFYPPYTPRVKKMLDMLVKFT